MTDKTKTTAERLAYLEQVLARMGIAIPDEQGDKPKKNPDFIEHGSDAHRIYLGLIELKDPSEAHNGEPVYTSPATGKVYKLEDPITAFVHFPDPMQVAGLVLIQKVNVLEGGAPTVPPNAPPLWRPADE